MQRVITFHYTLKNAAGETLDSTTESGPFSFIEGNREIISELEKKLAQLKQGDKKLFEISAFDAYGTRIENLVVKVAREKLQTQNVQVGDKFRGGPKPEDPIFTVVHASETEVTLDGNHPLAGMDLFFDVEITGIREATPQELSHGHSHGPKGTDH